MFPEAEVNAEQVNKRPITVKISSDGVDIVQVDQKKLFGKYGWPAEKTINEALLKFQDNLAAKDEA